MLLNVLLGLLLGIGVVAGALFAAVRPVLARDSGVAAGSDTTSYIAGNDYSYGSDGASDASCGADGGHGCG